MAKLCFTDSKFIVIRSTTFVDASITDNKWGKNLVLLLWLIKCKVIIWVQKFLVVDYCLRNKESLDSTLKKKV